VTLSVELLSTSSGRAAQNPFQPDAVGSKYRTHFLIYDVQNKSTTTHFTIEGEWHAPNWTLDGTIYGSQKMIATNDHALSWDGKPIAVKGISSAFAGLLRPLRRQALFQLFEEIAGIYCDLVISLSQEPRIQNLPHRMDRQCPCSGPLVDMGKVGASASCWNLQGQFPGR
jgi:hypothetical protein